MKWKTAALVCTVEVELQPVRIDVVQGNAQLSGHVLHDAAEASWDEEHLDVALVQTVHELPEKKARTDTPAAFTWTQIIGIKGPNQIKNASCERANRKILIRCAPFGKGSHSGRERWFVPIIIPNGVCVLTHSDPVFLIGMKWSPLRVCATLAWCVSAFAAPGRLSASGKHGGSTASSSTTLSGKSGNSVHPQIGLFWLCWLNDWCTNAHVTLGTSYFVSM